MNFKNLAAIDVAAAYEQFNLRRKMSAALHHRAGTACAGGTR